MGHFGKWLQTNKLNEDLSSNQQMQVGKAADRLEAAKAALRNKNGRTEVLAELLKAMLEGMHREEGDAMKAYNSLKMTIKAALQQIQAAARQEETPAVTDPRPDRFTPKMQQNQKVVGGTTPE